jgi:hypothetical protein
LNHRHHQYSCECESDEDAPEVGTQWARNKISPFSIKGPAVVKGKKLYIYPEQYEGQECDPLRNNAMARSRDNFSVTCYAANPYLLGSVFQKSMPAA